MIISTLLDRFAPDILISNRQTRDQRFRQLLMLGMIIDHPASITALERYGSIKREWAARNPAWDDLTTSEQDGLVLQHLDAISADVANRIEGKQHWLGYSSGYDARLIHVGLRRAGVTPNTFTFGQPGNADFDLAILSTERGLVAPRLFDTSEIHWRLDDLDRTAPYLNDLPPSPRIPVALALADGGPFIEPHGHQNGMLTNLQQPSRSGRKDVLGIFLEANDSFALQRFASPTAVGKLVPPLADVGVPPLLSLTLAYRLEQRIRPRPLPGVEYSLPFDDPRWTGLWLNMPERELPGQRRFLEFLSRLDGPEFFDLQHDLAQDRTPKRRGNLALLYGSEPGRRDAIAAQRGKVAPRKPTSHFDYRACYLNNVSFRDMVDGSLARLRGRNLFRPAFLDSTVRAFQADDAQAERMICGLVTIDIATQGGVIGT